MRQSEAYKTISILYAHLYVLWWTITLIEVYFISQSFSIAGCNIDLVSTLELPSGLFEVPFTFIVYEIFTIGVKMREENQLTV